MRAAPRFWWTTRPTLTARLLQPAGFIYGAATARRMRQPGARLPVPVLCVGNFVVGGAGKTPTALALAECLASLGHRPAFLSRGYGREQGSVDVVAVDLDRHTAAQVGDEPLLLARAGPTFVSRDRRAAGHAAVRAGATVLILDDGLQNPALHKDVSVVVADGRLGAGNGLALPAGPLRAPLSAQWPQASALCVIGSGAPGLKLEETARGRGLPVWRATLVPDPQAVASLRTRRLFAFAGIGRPSKFFDTLRACGLELAATREFPDHHRFTSSELDDLRAAAARCGASLVTTEKDHVRLPREAGIETLPVRLAFEAGSDVRAWLGERFNPVQSA